MRYGSSNFSLSSRRAAGVDALRTLLVVGSVLPTLDRELRCKFHFLEPMKVFSFSIPYPQSARGIPKGKAEEMLEKENLIRFPLRPPRESENHAEGSRRLFAYFLVGEKV